MAKQKSYPGFQTGSSFLLIVFVVVCMVLFGVLSLSGAVGDIHYSTRSLQKTKDYYRAVSAVEEKLALLDVCIRTDGSLPEGVARVESPDAGQVLYYYEVPINEKQSLHVEVEPVDPKVYGQYFLVTAFEERSHNTVSVDLQESMPLMRFSEEGGGGL